METFILYVVFVIDLDICFLQIRFHFDIEGSSVIKSNLTQCYKTIKHELTMS